MLMLRLGEALRAECRPLLPKPFALSEIPMRVVQLLAGQPVLWEDAAGERERDLSGGLGATMLLLTTIRP
jgi:hypothetical protein